MNAPSQPAATPPSPGASQATQGPDGLPRLAIAGGVYSENPAYRMLIVNGQVLREGAEPTPGLVVEQIRADRAILNFRGRRYTVMF